MRRITRKHRRRAVGGREAELRGLRLELLLAWPWTTEEMLGQPDAVAESRSRLGRQEAELRARLSTVDVTAVQWTGSAGQALVGAGEHAAMLALGSRGLSTLRGFLVGPVGLHVLERAVCPIVLARPTRDTPRSTGEVVLRLDLDHHCGEVIAFAFESAARRPVPLRVVHAWRPPDGGDLTPAWSRSSRRSWRRTRCSAPPPRSSPGGRGTPP
ncbi:universal stress protein [Kitasatospora camelliae]|uniref:Universal stress protein n=1 Tax=Kitasatospora camelliae TaxID=3156397 RepID=A0AAU8JMU1_9ACTN